MRRKHRFIKRFVKALGYRQKALAGGGAREVARRLRQIGAGQLQVSA